MNHQCDKTFHFTEVILGPQSKGSKLHVVFLVLLDPHIILG